MARGPQLVRQGVKSGRQATSVQNNLKKKKDKILLKLLISHV